MYFGSSKKDHKYNLTDRVASLASNRDAKSKLAAKNLNICKVAWDDTSRYTNSCMGDNITDMTLKVGSTRMPIIRTHNFTDTTIDLPTDKLPMLVVGNENDSELKKITIKEYLENLHCYCGDKVNNINLYDDRDQHILTSAQACILPVDNNKIEFAVDLYNYQSGSEPAVLVIMATAYGTSAQVVCRGNSVLYFNFNGTNRLFKAERLCDYRVSQGIATDGDMTSEEKSLNGIYIFQIPLKIFERRYPRFVDCRYDESSGRDRFGGRNESMMNSRTDRGMERAILTLGDKKGQFKGIEKNSGETYKLVRDTGKPIRLTVQFYLCSDTENITNDNVEDISSQIRHIYDKGLNEGSLVVESSVKQIALPPREHSLLSKDNVNNDNTKPGIKKTESIRPTQTTQTQSFLNNSIL